MARRRHPLPPPPPQLVGLAVLLSVAAAAVAKTDQRDVEALNVMFNSMNKPSQLSGWKSSGGDPCGDDDDWKGIECSGSSVTEIDVSNNNLNGDIPYQLPPNLVQLNLYGNSFSGGVPYSISQMDDLETLNVGKNHLNGQLTDMFSELPKLSTLDLSFNRFSGSLPQSFQHLKNLKTLNVESNQFSGHIDVLAKLPLEDLNLQNNKFNGWIPSKLKDINNLQIGGNQWSSRSAPPGMEKGSALASSSGGGSGSGMNGFAIGAIVIAVLLGALIILSVLKRNHSSPSSSHYLMDESGHNRSFTPLVDDGRVNKESSAINMKPLEHSSSIGSRTPSAVPRKSISDNEFENKLNYSRRSTDPINLVTYSSSDLQAATGSFHSSRLLGQGTIGGVYKAKYTDGRVLAVKKFDPLSFSGSSDFMDHVNSISKLRHPNISELVGYCSEPGHYMLVYDYHMNGSLYDFLHLYLHDVCSPSVIHKNIKASNVLLDADLNPRLTDCGLAYFYEDTSESLGPGYNPPECTRSSGYVMKSDVYCFGVVMLQLLTGRKPYDSSKPRTEQSLVNFVTPKLHDIDALGALADPALRGLYPPKALSRFADVLARCVQSDPEFRPSMSDVMQSLLQCVQRTTSNRRMGGLRSISQRSDDSDW
ncbi:Protein STRUBBELIG-RECEPTOR FAMILY 5 [Dichanthelium oligosanthes]|uniref:Protein STRUBBELIG-RECEPTOR FAMILY 5 n=1 Tax=Dichanthelium oligosanthes TaxID=888268 RepID=A0A1E5VNI5_9POAL|nr:Protein STRUBBELIG-RECEPTOR FAMILY 5 [Dichanthelium oligosanthes]